MATMRSERIDKLTKDEKWFRPAGKESQLLSNDYAGLLSHREKIKKKKAEINRINKLESDVSEMKDMLQQILEKL